MSGDKNFMSKAIHLFMNMDKMIGGQFEKGLAEMKSIVEAAPQAVARRLQLKGQNMFETNSAAITLTKPSDREIALTRIFDAPRKIVFKSYTDPDLIPQWWGPRDFTTIVDHMNMRPGGIWRFVQRGPDGNEYAFNAVYRGIVPTDWLAYTYEFKSTTGHVLLETVTFEDRGGKTKVTATALFDAVKDRDGMLNTGMEKGAAES
jgi:uncharacterized protein YndB with AHSA1/START domain